MKAQRTGVALLIAISAALLVAGCGGPRLQAPTCQAYWDGAGSLVGEVNHPEGLGVDRNGCLLVADSWNDRILRCDESGRPVAAFGETGQKKGQLLRPRAVTSDRRGNIYVVDCWNHRIGKFSASGEFVMAFGEKGGPWGYDEAPGKFVYPYGVAVDSQGFIYVSDFNNNRVHKFNAMGKFVNMWGIEGRQDGQFSNPAGLAIDSKDRLYVCDLGNDRVQRFRFDREEKAVFDGKWGESGDEPGEFDHPYSVCVDKDDNFYVADFGNHRVQCFSSDGKLQYVCGKRGSGEGELELPVGIAVDGQGALYVAELGNNRVQKFGPAS